MFKWLNFWRKWNSAAEDARKKTAPPSDAHNKMWEYAHLTQEVLDAITRDNDAHIIDKHHA